MKYALLFFLLAAFACSKEKFPDEDDLQGNWIQDTSALDKCELRFEGTTLFKEQGSYTDTFSYRLDKKEGEIFLTLKSHPQDGESSLKIEIARKEGYLIIWDLFIGIPENPPRPFKFLRE